MAKFRKLDRVSIQGVINGNYIHEGKIKVRIEPYSDIFVEISDLTMVRPDIVVGDTVWRPDKSTTHATVLATIDDHLWVSFGDGNYATWYAPQVQRLDLDAAPAEMEPQPIAPSTEPVEPPPDPAPVAATDPDDDLPF
ncbi:hypothetical protein [Mesorhizobium onobrychidis]|uniref:Uncharacterized protein n=1 Tax=Mesorhizobium onobrychidis TaxID=2775404 RepID=A0ABY5QU82_9HYPH|nr:hypothetical protein [Mesorhizobium onobrychidis]UVC14746.1 hypothetical protein IHQ72_29720 [Mesorhizobium onobrychidis]